MVKIFVGNLEEGSDCDELQKLFEKFGQVNECDIIKNYGFVHMEMEEEAQAAIAALHGFEFYGSKMNVEMSHGKSKPRGGFSSRGGPRGGGYRGGGPPMRGRGRGRGDYGDDRMNGYQSSRGGGYPDPYERRQYPPPYERPIYADYRPPPAERAVSYPGLGPRGGDYPPRPEYSRPYEYRRPYEYERSPTYAAERAPPDPYARSAEPVYRERSPVGRAAAADPYARPSPEYYQQRSRYSESNMYPPTADRYSDPYPPPGTSYPASRAPPSSYGARGAGY